MSDSSKMSFRTRPEYPSNRRVQRHASFPSARRVPQELRPQPPLPRTARRASVISTVTLPETTIPSPHHPQPNQQEEFPRIYSPRWYIFWMLFCFLGLFLMLKFLAFPYFLFLTGTNVDNNKGKQRLLLFESFHIVSEIPIIGFRLGVTQGICPVRYQIFEWDRFYAENPGHKTVTEEDFDDEIDIETQMKYSPKLRDVLYSCDVPRPDTNSISGKFTGTQCLDEKLIRGFEFAVDDYYCIQHQASTWKDAGYWPELLAFEKKSVAIEYKDSFFKRVKEVVVFHSQWMRGLLKGFLKGATVHLDENSNLITVRYYNVS